MAAAISGVALVPLPTEAIVEAHRKCCALRRLIVATRRFRPETLLAEANKRHEGGEDHYETDF